MSKALFTKERIYLFVPLIIFIILSLLFWRGLSLDPTAMPSALLNKPLPTFDLPVLAAPENPEAVIQANQQMLKGKPALINVWATWCITCRQEHEFLNELAKQGVTIYGINYKDNNEDAQRWLAELHNPYVFSIVDADGRLGLNLGVFGAPETYFIDKEGIIRYKHVGDINPRNWNDTLRAVYEGL